MKILIKNAQVLVFEGEKAVVKKADIGIEGSRIVQIGEVKADFDAQRVIDASNMLAMPGLINTHTHLSMNLFRNYADDMPLWDWLTKKIWPLEEKLTAEAVYWGSTLGIAELIKSGVTGFLDMYFFAKETIKVVLDTGIRAYIARGLTDEEEGKEAQLEETRELYQKYHEKEGRVKIFAGPHAPYTCSPRYLKKVRALSDELGIGIHIHLSETQKEVDESIEKWGKTPIKHVYDLGILERPTIAAHCVHVNDNDIEILANCKVSVAHNPTSNLKLASGFAPIEKMLKANVNVALGTDGASSNNNLNMFEEMHLASIINKCVNSDATSVPAEAVIKMATINGAKALGVEKELGSIKVGKKADIILIDLNKPHLCPLHNPLSAICYSAQGSDVHTVIVDGKILMENYELKTIDVEKAMYKTAECSRKLIES
ncbi:5-methylthioadenosine/S-adenosylhomocysteine deaminase [Tepidanaerobacter acetatoxydans Re1]|uniref:5-methylthioadenosine/S-adenosylhomocysteine deaminase n=1 Tax=Tepidanaerobacter acetatoxydans (strain DSM 21804 / JCM 16047 / Re1) TaxID=1209989 RepID=F4LQQ2_TEPAE|nr:amidohydrolase [Tepidanaerobacter acetatoxydans]AEE92055.1 5-methylthioadenosine/S-adenosylhomocysteine deaminase [Tepidanaerobacter acetatoxydans Re1]CDI40885.1 5-methylthioadenosine/S-adenosylhomocysteine deaminase [Tepidanaerobacter acetatoxydans Re1]